MITMKERFIYQIRVPYAMLPGDVVSQLTHAAWHALVNVPTLKRLDSHRWPSLYLVFRNAFEKRLVRYPGCGTLPECNGGLRSVYEAGRHGYGRMFTLELRKTLPASVRTLARAAVRRIRDVFPDAVETKSDLVDDVEGALHLALRPFLYHGTACTTCPVRSGPGERHLWGDVQEGLQ